MATETREKEREEIEDVGGRKTYRTLDEQEGQLSEAEQRFERRRRTVGLFLGPVVLAVMLLIPFDLDGTSTGSPRSSPLSSSGGSPRRFPSR